MANENIYLGQICLENIPPRPRGFPQIVVTFEIDATNTITVTAKEKDSAEMVEEDPWGLNSKWSEIESINTDSTRPNAPNLDADGNTPPPDAVTPAQAQAHAQAQKAATAQAKTQARLGSDKSIASFGEVYQRTKDDDDDTRERWQAEQSSHMD